MLNFSGASKFGSHREDEVKLRKGRKSLVTIKGSPFYGEERLHGQRVEEWIISKVYGLSLCIIQNVAYCALHLTVDEVTFLYVNLPVILWN